ncbi:TPA: aspartate--tRNA ligase [Candidatus Poribacteria bacterium]|nr:aspartate--tRNA ligase [Candidatus Poribacteria bacterium]|tara:strand:+ start:859 stop:2628 length:1770 start_codon:yes stop_codon:yes gene_type:complete
MQKMKRSHYCGELRLADAGQAAKLTGWVMRRRDHGGVIFVDLRDKSGITQVVFDPMISQVAHELANQIRNEFVLCVSGKIRGRGEGATNPNLPTGEIEIAADQLEILNTAQTPPFLVEDDINVAEEVRLKHRYLDLRRPKMQKALLTRHKAMLACRNYMSEQGFIEVETPILMNSTPEGARDVLVPSRLNHGQFYALPQSPQQFKQILMMSGIDRYFQIPKCFRDEDTRADRQLEFTQIDYEMSFATQDDVIEITEGLMKRIFEEAADIPVNVPFNRMSYADAMSRFGSDKPDTRFDMELYNLSDLVADCDFKVFSSVVSNGGQVKGLAVPDGANQFSRRDIDELTNLVAVYQAKGLAWIKVTENGFDSGIVKFFTEETLNAIAERMKATRGDLMLFVADTPKVVADSLSNLRLHLGRSLDLIDHNRYDFLWVVDFPLFEWNAEEDRYEPAHHLFTAPSDDSIPLLDTDPGKAQSQHYDLVINGNEVASGSVRIHRWEIQQKILEHLNISPEEVKSRFGYFIEALQYGTPPHAGIAPGLDRLVMIMLGEENIREVIAFPKTQRGACLMTGAPSDVTDFQLEELSIKIDA